MYDGCFGLNRRPFASVPQIDRYFAATAIEGARTTLARCIQRGEGAGLVIGPSGTGKTLLCLLLAEQFRRSFQVAMLASGRLSTRRALFQAILYELGRPYRGMDEGETRLAVIDYLMAGDDELAGPGAAGGRGPHAAAAPVGRNPPADQPCSQRSTAGAVW